MTKKQEKLEELKERLDFTKFYINHNRESAKTKIYTIGKSKKLVQGEVRKIRLPFTILKVDDYPKIEFGGEDGSAKYYFNDFKVIKDFQLLKLDRDENGDK